MASEGCYVGLNGGVKQLANELWGVPFGTGSYIFGRFLAEVWKPHQKDELDRAEKVVKEMVRKFHDAGHSGGSACVATQNLVSVMGCGAVSKEEFEIYFRPKDDEKVINTRALLEKAGQNS